MSNKKEIVKYKNPVNFNIGFVIFFIIIVYVLFNIFSYFTKTHVAEYQVQQGTIASNYIYQGIILRDETVEYANQTGYINYYITNAKKVSVTDVIYSIDTIGNIHTELNSAANNNQAISSDTIHSVSKKIDTFITDYNSNQFSKAYTLANSVETEITQDINAYALMNISAQVDEAIGNNTFYQVCSPEDGIIVYEIDGYENHTIEDIISSPISYSAYKENYLFSNSEIASGSPVYKRINSECWNIIVPIHESLAKELQEKSSVKIRFCKDDFQTNAVSSVIKEKDNYFLNLELKTAMIRYVNDRFVDIELVMGDKTGLKIPQSSITSKEFFTIPKEYFTLGGDSDKPGLLIKHTDKNANSVQLVTPTIYYETEDFYYVDNEEVLAGDIVLMSDSSSTYTIGTDVNSLVGVYNINKGYAVFKQINIIYENKDYAIVETKTSYGIALYDHIALNASSISEHELTTK